MRTIINYFGFNRPPMPPAPPMGRCCCNSFNPFNTMMQMSMMNSLFSLMMPSYSMANQTYPTFTMPSYNNIYTNNYTMPSLYTMPNNIFANNYTLPQFNYTTPVLNNSFLNFTMPSFNTNVTRTSTSTKTTSTKKSDTTKSEDKTQIDKSFKNSQKLDKNFLNKVKQVAKKVNCDYKDLLAVMNSESGIQANKWNGKVAVGLIQFTQPAIDDLNQKYGLNLTKDEIAKMSAIDQLDLVEKYLLLAKGYAFGKDSNKKLSASELYAITFLSGRANRDVLCSRGEKYYSQNSGLDLDNDGKITQSDLAQRVNGKRVDESVFA